MADLIDIAHLRLSGRRVFHEVIIGYHGRICATVGEQEHMTADRSRSGAACSAERV